jgi:hypothetical protein
LRVDRAYRVIGDEVFSVGDLHIVCGTEDVFGLLECVLNLAGREECCTGCILRKVNN